MGIVAGEGDGLVGVPGVVTDADGGVLGELAEGAVGFRVGERDGAEVAAVVGAFEGEVEGGFDLAVFETIREGGAAFGERVFFFDGGFEQEGGDGGPVGGLAEEGVAFAAAEQERKPGDEGGHRGGLYYFLRMVKKLLMPANLSSGWSYDGWVGQEDDE